MHGEYLVTMPIFRQFFPQEETTCHRSSGLKKGFTELFQMLCKVMPHS